MRMQRFYREGGKKQAFAHNRVVGEFHVPLGFSSCPLPTTAVILSVVGASQREALTKSKDLALFGMETIHRGILAAAWREFPEAA
jgi:hypothetical protein